MDQSKQYSVAGGMELFRTFDAVRITTVLSHGDRLGSGAGQRHTGRCWRWPASCGREGSSVASSPVPGCS